MEQKEQKKDVFLNFLNKRVKVILNISGRVIIYKGILIDVDSEAIVVNDHISGDLIIQRKEISQILLMNGVLR